MEEAQGDAHRDRSRVNFSFCERPGVATRLAVDSVFLAALHGSRSVHGGHVVVAVGAWPAHGPWRGRLAGSFVHGFERSVGADGAYVRIFDALQLSAHAYRALQLRYTAYSHYTIVVLYSPIRRSSG